MIILIAHWCGCAAMVTIVIVVTGGGGFCGPRPRCRWWPPRSSLSLSLIGMDALPWSPLSFSSLMVVVGSVVLIFILALVAGSGVLGHHHCHRRGWCWWLPP